MHHLDAVTCVIGCSAPFSLPSTSNTATHRHCQCRLPRTARRLVVNVQSFSKCFALCTGALAGSITGVATTPLDVIKTRLMTQGSKRTYSGVIDCARKIGQEEGYATFLQVHADKSEKQLSAVRMSTECRYSVAWQELSTQQC